MYAQRLSLYHFRLYTRRTFTFSPHFNIIEGPNAHGKTALLEALYLAAVGASFRTHHSAELIRRGSTGFGIEVVYFCCGIEQHVKVTATVAEKHAYVNGIQQGSLSALLGGMKAAVLTPDDSSLIKGAPQLRRHYLDVQLGQVDPLYNHHLKRYARALKQRNCLLKAGSDATLDSWEYELAHAAAYLMIHRQAAVRALAPRIEHLYRQLSGREGVLQLHYRCGSSSYQENWTEQQCQEQLRARWRATRSRDSLVGMTLSGPHKDDLVLTLDGLELRHYGSEGEKRTGAAVLRLAEWEEIAARSQGELPLLLIDDLGIGLDPQRQAHFMHYLSSAGQVLITTAQPLRWSSEDRETVHISLC